MVAQCHDWRQGWRGGGIGQEVWGTKLITQKSGKSPEFVELYLRYLNGMAPT